MKARLPWNALSYFEAMETVFILSVQQAGTGPSRRHIQGSKIAKGLQSVNLQYSKIKKPKNGPSGAPGPASASLWRGKERKILEKKFHNAEKLKG